MSLPSRPIGPVPADTTQVARAAFPKGSRYMILRDELGSIYSDEQFAELYPIQGQPTLLVAGFRVLAIT